jgi:glycosyltransferase involved in cell wall biosynthesis
MTDRPRVLWLGSEVTTRPRSGGAIRSLRLVEGLSEHADVDLVTTEESVAPPRLHSHFAGAKPPKPVVVANAVARRWPVGTARSVSSATRAAVARALPQADWVVSEWVHLAPLLPRTGPFLLAPHDADADRLAGLPVEGDAVRRWFRRRDARLVRDTERRLTTDPRCTVVAVSERDRDLLGGRGVVVPNGTDVPASVTDVPETGDVLYVGAMEYPPNVLAVDWWAEDVWPLLPDGAPPLSVAGRGSAAALGKYAGHPGVRVLGEVESVAPLLERAALVAVPLHHGGGTRLKVLEAFAANRPVLSTSKGVEGIPLTFGVHCEVADDAASYAALVVALLGDLRRRRALAAAARSVANEHDWARLGERFAEVVLASPRRAR